MTTVFFASYGLLWLITIGCCILIFALAREVVELRRVLTGTAPMSVAPTMTELDMPLPDDDGPSLDTQVPAITLEPLNGRSPIELGNLLGGKAMVIVFSSPMCESCQRLVAPLNRAVHGYPQTRFVTVMRADKQACTAFLNVFPLDMPVYCDEDRRVTMGFEVHHNPYILVYRDDGKLIGKGVATSREELDNLLQLSLAGGTDVATKTSEEITADVT